MRLDCSFTSKAVLFTVFIQILFASLFIYAVFIVNHDDKARFPWKSYLSLRSSIPSGLQVIGFDELALFWRNMTNRWNNITGITVLPNWTIDSQFATFSNITIPKNINFPMDHPSLCNDTVEALIIVQSAGSNKTKRDKLRNEFPIPPNWRRVFLVGHPIMNAHGMTTCKPKIDHCEYDRVLEENLIKENIEYEDLILGDFIDIYQNLTMKTSAMLKWATTRCMNAKYLFKCDDDVYPNFTTLTKIVNNWNAQNQSLYHWFGTTTTYKALRHGYHTIVTFDEFPGFHFTQYASGGRYAMTMDVAQLLAEMTKRVPFLPIEDVYTGLLGHMAGIELTYSFFDTEESGECKLGFIYSDTMFANKIVNTWRKKCPYKVPQNDVISLESKISRENHDVVVSRHTI